MIDSRFLRDIPFRIRIALRRDPQYEDPEQSTLSPNSSAAVAASNLIGYLRVKGQNSDVRAIHFLWHAFCNLTPVQQKALLNKMQSRMGRPSKTCRTTRVKVDRQSVLRNRLFGTIFLIEHLGNLTGKQAWWFAQKVAARNGRPPMPDEQERERLRLGVRLNSLIENEQMIGSDGRLRGEGGPYDKAIESILKNCGSERTATRAMQDFRELHRLKVVDNAGEYPKLEPLRPGDGYS